MSELPVPGYSAQPKTWHCGTLTYTKPALTILFFWLLWGDVCYTLMESVTGPIMLKKFEKLGAMNWEIALILTTIPTTVYSMLNPVISFKSDRYRSRWGRRIPFILFTLPLLVLALVGLAFGDRLGFWLHGHLNPAGISPNRMAMWTLGLLLVVFTFFNTFVCSTFWYLFNDVVPEHLLARFMSWFRSIGTIAASIYSFFIFPYSGTHSTAIFLGAAALYLVGFGLMCFYVREGQYAPPAAYAGGGSGAIAMITTYGKECHSHKHYWYLWICTFIGAIGGGVGAFDLFFKQAIGLDMQHIGYLNGTISATVFVLILGSGWLADRFHPIRVVLAAIILGLVLVTPSSMIWLFWHPSPHVAFWTSMAMGIGLLAPAAALGGMWDPPMLMRVFPRSNYGTFCSTNAIWRSVGAMIGGIMAGGFLDIMTPLVGKDRAYCFSPIWSIFFAIPSFILFLKFYQSWKRCGGDDNYLPPCPDTVAPLAEAVAEESEAALMSIT